MLDLLGAAERTGTPAYVFDRSKIIGNITRIKESLAYPNSKIHYAMFCNDDPQVLEIVKKQGLGVLVLNEREMKTAISAGFEPKSIHLTGGTFTESKLRRLLDYNVDINLDSVEQLELLGRIKQGCNAGIRIRVSDETVAGSGEGAHLNDTEKIMEVASKHDLTINGLQTYIGTNTLDEEKYVEAARILLKLAEEFPQIEYVNIGGGFGIPYSATDKPFSWQKFGAGVSRLFLGLKRGIQLKLEPGRSIVGDAGYFLTSVIELRGRDTIVVDSPYTLFPRPFVYHTNHRVSLLGRETNARLKEFKIRGCSINSRDYLSHPDFEGDPARLPQDVAPGDILCFRDVGAYSPPMQMEFLHYERAPVILV